jgi:signal transduction histidine kinase
MNFFTGFKNKICSCFLTRIILKPIKKLIKSREKNTPINTEIIPTVCHEFRTPLTSIKMSVELLLEENIGSLTNQQREMLIAAREDCDRLSSLIDDLLELAKIDTGQIKLDFQPIAVDKIVNSALHSIKLPAKEKNIELKSDLEYDLPAVRADFEKINWVLNNLLNNALRHTPEEGTITVSSRRRDSLVHISVSDTGEGILDKYRDKIFDRFVSIRGENENSGSGLGLAISKKIVEAHGEKIWLENSRKPGATFTFTLNSSPVSNPQGQNTTD